MVTGRDRRSPWGMVRSTLRSSSATEDGYLTMIGKTVRPEVYPPTAAPKATRVSKDEQGEGDFLP
ncbi:MAG: hypothetical protein V1758_10865 [Pseudomonadota bacterium]